MVSSNATGLTGHRQAKRDGYRAAPLLDGPVEALVGRHSSFPFTGRPPKLWFSELNSPKINLFQRFD